MRRVLDRYFLSRYSRWFEWLLVALAVACFTVAIVITIVTGL